MSGINNFGIFNPISSVKQWSKPIWKAGQILHKNHKKLLKSEKFENSKFAKFLDKCQYFGQNLSFFEEEFKYRKIPIGLSTAIKYFWNKMNRLVKVPNRFKCVLKLINFHTCIKIASILNQNLIYTKPLNPMLN